MRPWYRELCLVVPIALLVVLVPLWIWLSYQAELDCNARGLHYRTWIAAVVPDGNGGVITIYDGACRP